RRKKPESSTTNTFTGIRPSCNSDVTEPNDATRSIHQDSRELARDSDTAIDSGSSSVWPRISGAARPRGARLPAQQAWDVQNQRHPSVAGNGGSGHTWRAMQHGAKRLDHDLFLANQLVDDKADLFRAHRHNHHVSHAFRTLLPGRPLEQPALNVEQR